MCKGRDTIRERDRAERHNSLTLENGKIFSSFGAMHFDLDSYFCSRCDVEVDLPQPIEDWVP